MALHWSTFALVIIGLQCSLIDGKRMYRYRTFFSIDLVACLAVENEETDGFRINRYKNDLFRLSVEIPENWHSISDEELRPLIQRFAEAELVTTVFGFAQYALGGKVNNPNIIALAAKRTNETNPCDPLIASREIVPQIIKTAYFNGECRQVILNGQTFGMQELEITSISSIATRQTQYSLFTDDGYILTFTLTYFNNDQKKILQGVMESLTFFN